MYILDNFTFFFYLTFIYIKYNFKNIVNYILLYILYKIYIFIERKKKKKKYYYIFISISISIIIKNINNLSIKF